MAGLSVSPLWAQTDVPSPALREVISRLEYLTPAEKFHMYGRGTPPPHTLPPEKLREVVWMARPGANIRRVFYYGYHNDDPEQRFQSSLPIGRVLEEPPGEQPVILCYKLNDQWLSPKAGAPVRMFVPDAYGNKSVKWGCRA